jgi:microtubule-associated protein-like 5
MRNCKSKPLTNPLLSTSLSKLREYYGSFKSVCDTFSIELTEYDNIFSSNETSFKIYDTDDNGLIDALELFAGLILFAEGKFEDKVSFLFEIIDFN